MQPAAKLLASAAAQDPRADRALEESEPPPDLDPAAGLFLSAWGDLQYDRDFMQTGAPLPIRWQTIQAWGQTQALSADEAALLTRLLRAMDAAYCQILAARIEAGLKETSPGRMRGD